MHPPMPARTRKPEADNPNKPLVEGPRKPEQAGTANLPPPLFGVLVVAGLVVTCLLYTSPSPRDRS